MPQLSFQNHGGRLQTFSISCGCPLLNSVGPAGGSFQARSSFCDCLGTVKCGRRTGSRSQRKVSTLSAGEKCWPRSLLGSCLCVRGGKSVGPRQESRNKLGVEEALRTYQPLMASAGVPGAPANEALLSATLTLAPGGSDSSVMGFQSPAWACPCRSPHHGKDSKNGSFGFLLQALPTLHQGQPGLAWSSGGL